MVSDVTLKIKEKIINVGFYGCVCVCVSECGVGCEGERGKG
jgi:hypothetical protein